MAPDFEDLTSTFVFTAGPRNATAVLAELPKGLPMDPARQRQGHRKSTLGCDNCKRRRCNEEVPCASCRRRGERCERPEKAKPVFEKRRQQAVPKSMATMAPSTASARASDSVVNLLHLKLFYHFQAHTAATLVFDASAWAAALQLSVRFEFLANAVLCVSARHLASLSGPTAAPEAAAYAAAAASHLCRALAGLRQELQTKDFFTATHLDAFIATSTLLQFELWSSTDVAPSNHGRRAGLDMERDRLFAFSASLKQVFLQNVPEALRHQPDSVFMPYIRRNPATALHEHARISDDTADAYRAFFAPRVPEKRLGSMKERFDETPPLLLRRKNASAASLWTPRNDPGTTNTAVSAEDGGYAHVLDGLCLLMSFLPENPSCQPDATTPEPPSAPLQADLARCVFSFPILCRGTFVSLLRKNDPDALFVLYHFYRTARLILPEPTCWWAHGRAVIMEQALHDWLETT
ncbi:hypothetical protein HMPREF1624_04215 [Sporothrix schenckii ATCC 58251]|uniref:Zn(2)-C6 fungal-type domain-containing protein n=1 Tax=Sporothrix schenckii (strain ATCC 58251 / de Perez 2211183) TaxID=1391915 RepID=U7PX36_SPOS1|nr:hypothetical protein HMPREF1624_04215 [Sporothrix schenckii ATCC 58251]